jgi:predicted SAM-dependent methyltransferase
MSRYLKSHTIRKLQLGAGSNALEGWLNTDKYAAHPGVTFLNAEHRFPFADNTFDYVFSEHLIEHLSYEQGLPMLRECFRVLKPAGKIRIATPDLETLAGLYAQQKTYLQQRYIHWIIDTFLPQADAYRESFVINNAFRNWGHRFLYDQATLECALASAGFADIVKQSVGESQDNVFRGIESHGLAAGDEEMNRFETMVLEARRLL